MRTAIATFATALLFTECGTHEDQAKQVAKEDRDISGQVFIVTRGRDNIKLALVIVNFFPENLILDQLKKKHEGKVAQQTTLLPRLADAQSALAAAEAKEKADKAAKD